VLFMSHNDKKCLASSVSDPDLDPDGSPGSGSE
jgi:hypothetical protein